MKLQFKKLGSYVISECFGWSEKKHDTLLKSMFDYSFTYKPESQIHTLHDYLLSKEFKALDIKFTSANDYFMLGMVFTTSAINIQRLTNGKVVELDTKREINL